MHQHRGISSGHDEIGNPLTYYNGSSYTFTWENGRRLKIATGVVHIYTVPGSLILTEEWSTNLIVYRYAVSDSPIGMRRWTILDILNFVLPNQ